MKIRVHLWPNFFGAIASGGLVIGFSLLLLWHDPLVFWNDDYELSILPVFSDVARSWSEGHLPLLSPYSWVCNNLAGEFQYGTFSIFVNAAVVLIWKFPLTFPQQAAALSITHLFVLAAGAFLLARDRRLSISLSIVRRVGRGVERLDHLLGGNGLVRRARRVYLAAVGVVGTCALTGSATNAVAISLAGAVRLSARNRRISLHGFDAHRFDCVVVDQIGWRNKELDVDLADVRRRRARFWIISASVACDLRLRLGLRALVAICGRALAMDRALARIACVSLAVLDSQLGRFLDPLSSAYRNGISVRPGRARCARCRIPLAADLGN